MKLLEESKKKIKEAYIGDIFWLDTIKEELTKYNSEEKDNILKLLESLYAMNYVMLECETEDYAYKYYTQVYDLYTDMKIDLMKMLNYEDMWEEIYY